MGDDEVTRVTGEARDTMASQLRARYEAGMSIRALAEEHGKSYGFVHRLLTESGTQLRARGGATRGVSARRGGVDWGDDQPLA